MSSLQATSMHVPTAQHNTFHLNESGLISEVHRLISTVVHQRLAAARMRHNSDMARIWLLEAQLTVATGKEQRMAMDFGRLVNENIALRKLVAEMKQGLDNRRVATAMLDGEEGCSSAKRPRYD